MHFDNIQNRAHGAFELLHPVEKRTYTDVRIRNDDSKRGAETNKEGE